jgi:hypothetical protein
METEESLKMGMCILENFIMVYFREMENLLVVNKLYMKENGLKEKEMEWGRNNYQMDRSSLVPLKIMSDMDKGNYITIKIRVYSKVNGLKEKHSKKESSLGKMAENMKASGTME